MWMRLNAILMLTAHQIALFYKLNHFMESNGIYHLIQQNCSDMLQVQTANII